MEQEFSTQRDFAEYLGTALSGRVSTAESKTFGDLVAAEFTEKRLPPEKPGAAGLRIPVLRWVIKDDDLKLIENVFDGLKAGAAAGLIVGEPTTAALVGAVVGIAAAVVKSGRQLLRKGRQLNELEYKVLLTLKAAPDGLTETELLAWIEIVAHQKYDEQTIRNCIQLLQAISLADGTVTSLVSKDANSRLRASGV